MNNQEKQIFCNINYLHYELYPTTWWYKWLCYRKYLKEIGIL